ncbi:MAG: acyl-CoA dehydrogenase family protein [Gemmatimonadota bacterium]
MSATLSEEGRMLRESAAALCGAEFPIERVRAMADDPDGVSAEAYRALATQGWLAILVPEERGGLGLGITELAIVLEELGKALVPGPFFSAATLGVPAVALSANDGLRQAWLEDLTGGGRRVTLALLEDAGLPSPGGLALSAESAGEGRYSLKGEKRFVPDLLGADGIAVVARGRQGPVVFLLDAKAPGVWIEENRSVDSASRYGTLRLDGVTVADSDVLGDWTLVERILAYANVGIAAIAVASAEAVFAQVVAYVKQRVQFGVPIGTFQAVQHPLANLFGEIESARSAYLYSAWAVDRGSEDQRRAVALARLTATAAYRHACTTSLQAHGGIGFTWEYDLHLHLKRALHLQNLLGGAEDFEEVIARDALGI